ncbi:ubiquitin 3 binding protein But2 C-terminal domain-containing protein [Kockiozyma suomiensis]|uniref:ubiquitin 3 binding protein But2 C-terminal domain-containing protein n=1 Tax=Kockiozyma suomiensis TaxID=1337062 RepID=UPI003343B47D
MKFYLASALGVAGAAVSLVSAAPLTKRDDPAYFSVLAIRSGSPIQLSPFSSAGDGKVYFGKSNLFSNYIEDGLLHIKDTDNLIWIDPDTNALTYGKAAPDGATDATWSVVDNDLVLNGEGNAIACGDDYQVFWSSDGSDSVCSGADALGANLLVEYYPSSSSSSVASATSTSTSASATSSTAYTDDFGVVAIRSGSPIQYASFSTNGDGNIYFGTGKYDFSNHIDRAGQLIIKGTKNIIWADPDTNALVYGPTPPDGAVSVIWSIDDGRLLLNGEARAVACNDDYQVFWSPAASTWTCANGDSLGADLMVNYIPVSTSSSVVATSTSAPSSTLVTKNIAKAAATTEAASAAEATVTFLPPNLLVPVKKATPTEVYGSQYTGSVVAGDKEIDTFVSFDIPSLGDSVKTCKLVWTPPSANSLPSTITGYKRFQIFKISDTLDTSKLSWNVRPTRGDLVGVVDASSGYFTSSAVSCDFGKKQQFELVPWGYSDDEVTWFQELNPVTGINYAMLD